MVKFNGVELMIPDSIAAQVAGDACPTGLGSWNLCSREYFSRRFPHSLRDPQIPIHVLEFLCVIIAVKKWGSEWSGKRVQIYCDNDSVCDVLTYLKPKDKRMQSLLREFLHWVCVFNFSPQVSKIGTKENSIADFLSRNFSDNDAEQFFMKENIYPLAKLNIIDEDFDLIADW